MIEPGQLVRYKGHHVHMRNKTWVYLGDTGYVGQRMAWLLAPEHAPSPLPTSQELTELQLGAIQFYKTAGRGQRADHPARRAGKDWWFELCSVYAEDISVIGEPAEYL